MEAKTSVQNNSENSRGLQRVNTVRRRAVMRDVRVFLCVGSEKRIFV